MSTRSSERELNTEILECEPLLQNEITWGLSYRSLKHCSKLSPIKPKHSPINFSLREKKKMKLKKIEKGKICENCVQLSLLDRSALSQDKYMNLLAIPNRISESSKHGTKRKKRLCCKYKTEPCPPRIVQMSVPKKISVVENWKAFKDILSAETLERFDVILKSANNLEPRDARYYFKELKKKEHRERRKQKLRCKKQQEEKKKGDNLWLKHETRYLADSIVRYIRNKPLFTLNFQQMTTCNLLCEYLTQENIVKLTSRNTKNEYKKTLVEINDKIVKWMDTMNFFTDIMPLDSKEKLDTLLEIPSLESLLKSEEGEEEKEGKIGKQDEGEEEEEAEEPEEKESKVIIEAEESEINEFEQLEEQFEAQKIVDKIDQFYQFDGEESDIDIFNVFTEDILEKLIQILSESSSEFLSKEIASENMPGVTYGNVLEKLKEIRDGKLLETGDKLLLEDKMIEWAKNNNPEQVDEKVVEKIHETSKILTKWFTMMDAMHYMQGFEEGEEDADETFIVDLTTIDQDQELENEDELEEFGEAEDVEEQEEEMLQMEDEGEELVHENEEENFEYAEEEEEEEGEDEKPLTEDEAIKDKEKKKKKAGPNETQEQEKLKGKEDDGQTEDQDKEQQQKEDAIVKEEKDKLKEKDYETQKETEREKDEGTKSEVVKPEEGFDTKEEGLNDLLTIIRGHKPSVVFEHKPGSICCLSLKIWAVWLLHISNNAHKWTQWITDIVRHVRHYATIIRGGITLPNGQKEVLYKEDWRKFVTETEEKIVAWRQYSQHVKNLSVEIIENFSGKKVSCCPKCLQDNLIKNVVTAHETLQALTEAINCAAYWQRCLNNIVEQTSKLTDLDIPEETVDETISLASEESVVIDIEEISHISRIASEASYESFYEIEELPGTACLASDYEIEEVQMPQPQLPVYELEELRVPKFKLPKPDDRN